MTYVIATVPGGPQTVDPALAYDTASGELIANIYDPLIFFSKDSGSSFVPWLADSYSMSPDGLTFTFHVRQGVQWQDPAYGMVTPADVEYSFERMMVRDYTGGPSWMFWYPIFGTFAANLTDPVSQGQAIDNAITRDDATGTVTIHFQTGKAYLPFLGILAQSWGSIVCKQWAADNGDWSGTGLNDGSWIAYHDPATSPLDSPAYKMMGSGPFKLNYLTAGTAWSILRFQNFWGGWGTSRTSLLGMSTITRGYLDEIVEYFIGDYATRLAGFTGTNPVYDSIAVPRSQIATVWQQPGIKQVYPLAGQTVDAMFFSYDVSLISPYIGSPTGYGYFGENGITPDFFSDVHVRRAMAYSFNWPAYITEAYLGEAQQVGIPLPAAGYEPYYNGSSALMYSNNNPQAILEWQQAWGGQVWTNGFKFSLPYPSGSLPRMQAQQILETNIEAVNPKFHVDVIPVSPIIWQQHMTYPPFDYRSIIPVYFTGWLVDYPDPDDWVTPFMESSGMFGRLQHMEMDPYSPLMDNLIEWGRRNTTIEGRNYNYQRLWRLYHDQAPSVPLENAFGRHVARDWVHGFYFNAIFPGVFGYPLWKENIYASTGTFMGKSADWEDINEDGKVDIKDLARAAKGFGGYFIQPILPPYPPLPPWYSPNWDSRVDLNVVDIVTGARGDMKIDIKDLATIAKLYGFVADTWTPGP